MAITAGMVKELREMTGAGMMQRLRRKPEESLQRVLLRLLSETTK